MLTPHEIATLILVANAPEEVEVGRPDLCSLLKRDLVQLDRASSGRRQMRVSTCGEQLVMRLYSALPSASLMGGRARVQWLR
jgi:hypothetical protein